jgi:hypothetical protein
MGYSDNSIDVVCSYEGSIPKEWLALQKKYRSVRFFFYPDTREDKVYPPSIQAHILAKHWRIHPYLSKEAVFFHDCDFVFTKKMNFNKFLNDDVWYFSDCTGYLGYDYIVSKSEALLEMMCNTVDLCSCVVKAHRKKAGGAQKLMKGVTYEYWESVEKDSVNLYNLLKNKQNVKKEGDEYGIQAWTASMWAELWNAWKRNRQVDVPEEFNFAWATDIKDKWDQVYFFHNAGVSDSNSGMFFKGNYMRDLPYSADMQLDEGRCSKKYFDIVKKVGENTCLT